MGTTSRRRPDAVTAAAAADPLTRRAPRHRRQAPARRRLGDQWPATAERRRVGCASIGVARLDAARRRRPPAARARAVGRRHLPLRLDANGRRRSAHRRRGDVGPPARDPQAALNAKPCARVTVGIAVPSRAGIARFRATVRSGTVRTMFRRLLIAGCAATVGVITVPVTSGAHPAPSLVSPTTTTTTPQPQWPWPRRVRRRRSSPPRRPPRRPRRRCHR